MLKTEYLLGIWSILFIRSLFFSFRSTVIVGAGYIAVELAGMLGNLGSETHLLIRKDNVLRTFDQTLSHALTEAIDAGPVHLHRRTEVTAFFNKELR